MTVFFWHFFIGANDVYQDATEAYNEVHSSSVVKEYLDASCNKGQVDESTVTADWKNRQASTQESAPKNDPKEKPPLDSILNMYDFEEVAEKFLSKKSWAFQMTAANDRLTRDANGEFWKKVYFRPRVLTGTMLDDQRWDPADSDTRRKGY